MSEMTSNNAGIKVTKRLTFSSYFGIKKNDVIKNGFYNISLVSDLSLFIDPFHLFYSKKEEYQSLHEEIIKYLIFLKEQSNRSGDELTKGAIEAYYKFPEIKQNWFGFTFYGNRGHGLSRKFAVALHGNFNRLFRDFGVETKSKHLEKLTLIADRVGKDTISDFTTNLIHGFLAKKTQEFTLKFIDKKKTNKFTIKKARFDYKNEVWVHETFILPSFENDYVLLTPRDLLTKDETWINKADLIRNFERIPRAIPDAALRQQLSAYFQSKLREYAEEKLNRKTKKLEPSITTKTRAKAAIDTIFEFPESLEVYIKIKEETGAEAQKNSEKLVSETEKFYEEKFIKFVEISGSPDTEPSSYTETLERAKYFKECIELRGGYKNLYHDDKPVDEDWIQRMFWFVWYGAKSDVNREPNNGRGKPDFVASQGRRDKTPIEFKLAKTRKLERNIQTQLEKYKEVEKTENGVWVIVFFTDKEREKVIGILEKNGLKNNPNYILVDARRDNKKPASKL